MFRTYADIDLVTLPKLSLADAIALTTAIASRARQAGPLPVPIEKALIRVEGGLQDARVVVSAMVEDQGILGTDSRSTDRILDAAWGAGRDWNAGWLRLPGQPEINAKAERVQTALFADGLRFTQRRYNVQWVESQARLDLIEEQGLEQIFIDLGGQVILQTIRDAHAAHGHALGLTAPVEAQAPAPGEVLRVLLDELRRYVVRVSAHVDPDEPATRVLAENLLLPLTTWQPSPSATGDADGEGDAGTGTGPTEPCTEPAEPGTKSVQPGAYALDIRRSAASGEIPLP